MASLPVGLWTIGLLLCLIFFIKIFIYSLCAIKLLGLSDYWTIALFYVLYQYSYTFTRTQEALYCWTIGPLDYPLIYIFTCKDIDFATVQ